MRILYLSYFKIQFGSDKNIQCLRDLDENLISEDDLWQSIQEGRREYKEGRARTMKSISELL